MTKRRTLRGLLPGNQSKRLVVDDGRLNHGYIVKEFYAWTTSISGQRNAELTLSLNKNTPSSWRADDGGQIGWAGMVTDVGGVESLQSFSLIDPDHVVLRDLYISSFNADDSNYMVVLETLDLTENETILTLVKEDFND
jgi:hypothetical protein